jgi:hypothetical protein
MPSLRSGAPNEKPASCFYTTKAEIPDGPAAGVGHAITV